MLLIYLSLRCYMYENSSGELTERDSDEIINGK